MKIFLTCLVLVLIASSSVYATCPTSAETLSQELTNLATAVQTNCAVVQGQDPAALCADNSPCLTSVLNFFAYLKDCDGQLESAGIDFTQFEQAITTTIDAS